MSSICFAAPLGNPRLAYFDSNKYSIGEPMRYISLVFDYIMVSEFFIVSGMIMLATHVSVCSTLGYTTVTRCSGTSHSEYKYKVFAKVISPCNSY